MMTPRKIPFSTIICLSLASIFISLSPNENTRYASFFCSASLHDVGSHVRDVQPQTQTQTQSQAPSEPAYSWDHNYHNPLAHPTLIVQALSPGPLEEILTITSHVNRAYAKRWGFDYLSFVSNTPDTGKDGGDGYWRSCPYLLHSLLKRNTINNGGSDAENNGNGSNGEQYGSDQSMVAYDTVMFLEANAVFVQLDFDILSLIESKSLVASGAVISNEASSEWSVGSIYSDVMLWNLKHPMIHNVTTAWLEAEMNANAGLNAGTGTGIIANDVGANANGDINYAPAMRMLDAMKRNVGDSNVIQEIPRDMVDGLKGTLIKQGWTYDIDGPHRGRGGQINGNGGIIEESDLYKIVPVIQGISDNVCYRYYPQCEIV